MRVPKLIWFEIPVIDLDRAARFYETIFDCQLPRVGPDEALFGVGEEAWGSLLRGKDNTPSVTGPLVTFDVGDDLPNVLNRVVAAGGEVLKPKTVIQPEIGYDAEFKDSEGNRISLFSKR
jgi:uncharacterized protein